MGSAARQAEEGARAIDRAALKVTPFCEMRRRDGVEHSIKGLLPVDVFAGVVGPSGSGKTFFVGYAAFCIGADREFLGHKVKAGLVVYLAPENPRSVEQRFAAWRDELEVEDAQLVLVAGDLDMLTSSTSIRLMKELRRIVEAYGPISVVVVDTVSQAMPGADENSSDGMTSFVRACQAIRGEFGCSVLAVHHTGKQVDRGARGHSSFFAALDVEISIADNAGSRSAEVTKMRDGEKGLRVDFRLKPIVVGHEPDGEPITTCLVEGDVAPQPSQRRERPRTANQKLVHQALERCVSVAGRAVPGKGFMVRGVSLQLLREEVIANEFGHIDPKHRSTRINEAITGLKASAFVDADDEWIWFSSPSPIPPRPFPLRGEGSGGAGERAPGEGDSGQFGESGDER